MRFGASAVLIENATPPNLVKIIETYRATICFTAPTAYRAMLAAMDEGADLSSLRLAVSAGETLPAPIYEAWTERTNVPILDGIGSTEMLHVFISNRLDDRRPGVTGKPVPGYEAKIVDQDFNEAPQGNGWTARGARPDGMPLSRRRAPTGLCAERLEPHRRRIQSG